MRAPLVWLTGLCAALAALAGCSCQTGALRPRTDGGTGTPTDGASSTTDTNVPPGTDGGTQPLGDGGFVACEGQHYDAQEGLAPLDIIWVIDNSGSMDEEAALVQSGMNAFASAISSSGIPDYHVVVITQTGWVTVPPPLGTDPSHFLFVDADVQSNEPLDEALSNLPRYQSFLRGPAITHFVFVTDDESDLPATAFLGQMQTALNKEFVAHAIVSPPGSTHRELFVTLPGCSGPHGEGAANGNEYWDLAMYTLGQQIDICSADWGNVFAQLTTAVAVPMMIPCVFDIPDPPPGMTFNRDRVNIRYTPGSTGVEEVIPRANDCTSGAGWTYDDPSAPTTIYLCPNECSRVEGDSSGQVQIELGCQSVII